MAGNTAGTGHRHRNSRRGTGTSAPGVGTRRERPGHRVARSPTPVGRLPFDSHAFADTAATVAQALLARLCKATAPDQPADESILARHLNNRSNRLSALGRREEALAAITEAIHIYRQLAAQRPDAYLPDFASSLNNLSVRLGDVGRREEAVAAATEAVEVYRRLAGRLPDAYLPDFASSMWAGLAAEPDASSETPGTAAPCSSAFNPAPQRPRCLVARSTSAHGCGCCAREPGAEHAPSPRVSPQPVLRAWFPCATNDVWSRTERARGAVTPSGAPAWTQNAIRILAYSNTDTSTTARRTFGACGIRGCVIVTPGRGSFTNRIGPVHCHCSGGVKPRVLTALSA